jgi:hypothetical protein
MQKRFFAPTVDCFQFFAMLSACARLSKQTQRLNCRQPTIGARPMPTKSINAANSARVLVTSRAFQGFQRVKEEAKTGGQVVPPHGIEP